MSRAAPLRIADYMRHILEAIDNIQVYTAGTDLTGFMADRKTQDAVIRNLKVVQQRCQESPRLCRATRRRAMGFCV